MLVRNMLIMVSFVLFRCLCKLQV